MAARSTLLVLVAQDTFACCTARGELLLSSQRLLGRVLLLRGRGKYTPTVILLITSGRWDLSSHTSYSVG